MAVLCVAMNDDLQGSLRGQRMSNADSAEVLKVTFTHRFHTLPSSFQMLTAELQFPLRRGRCLGNKGKKRALAWKSEIGALVGYSLLLPSQTLLAENAYHTTDGLQRTSRAIHITN